MQWSYELLLNHSNFYTLKENISIFSLHIYLKSIKHNSKIQTTMFFYPRVSFPWKSSLKECLFLSSIYLFKSKSTKKTSYTARVTIWYQLFLEFWLVYTWIFAHWRHQCAVARLKNVRQLNERWGKKLDINLLHR